MVRESAQKSLAKDLSPWTLFGIVSMLLSGALMFATDPDMYYLNHPFQGKMTCLALAILFHYTLRKKAIAAGTATASTALISLLLWAGVLAGGIFIGFYA